MLIELYKPNTCLFRIPKKLVSRWLCLIWFQCSIFIWMTFDSNLIYIFIADAGNHDKIIRENGMFIDTKVVIRSFKSKKERQHTDLKKRDKKTNYVRQHITQIEQHQARSWISNVICHMSWYFCFVFHYDAMWLFTLLILVELMTRRVWRYQRGDRNPYIEEEQTTQWPKDKNTKGQTTIYKTYI